MRARRRNASSTRELNAQRDHAQAREAGLKIYRQFAPTEQLELRRLQFRADTLVAELDEQSAEGDR